MENFIDACANQMMYEAIAAFTQLSESEKRDAVITLIPPGVPELPIHLFPDIEWYELLLPYCNLEGIKSQRTGRTLLAQAILLDKTAEVKWLVDHKANVLRKSRGIYPLSIALDKMHIRIVEILLSANPHFDVWLPSVSYCRKCINRARPVESCSIHCRIFSTYNLEFTMRALCSISYAFLPEWIRVMYFYALINARCDVGYLERFIKSYPFNPKTIDRRNFVPASTFIPEIAPLLVTHDLLTEEMAEHFIYMAIRHGMYDKIGILLSVTTVFWKDMLYVTAISPRCTDILMWFIAFADDFPNVYDENVKREIAQFRIHLQKDPLILEEIKKIYYLHCYARDEHDEIPSLFDIVEFRMKVNAIQDDMVELKSRIENARITKDWRSILQ